MIPQAALSLTFSKLHTVEYYIELAENYIELGAEEICIKDMAGIGRPASIGRIIKGIRERHPDIVIQYHGHSTPGFSVASSLEAARNGADIIDVGMEPLSYGTGHADLLTIHAMLKDDGFDLPDINMRAYMEVRGLTQEFMDDFLGMYINPMNRKMNPLLIGPGLPGGMMGSLMADLENNLASLNKWFKKNNKNTITQDELLIRLFDEVQYAWPRLGYPPLVTPFSQYVKNAALMNVILLAKGRKRWEMLDENTWSMILGKSGQLLGDLDEEILALADAQNREFFTGNPQDLYPDELPLYRDKMKEKAWETGKDDEELLEYAMHPQQYEAYKSGQAKLNFKIDLAKRREASTQPVPQSSPAVASAAPVSTQPKQLEITVDGEKFKVEINYPTDTDTPPSTKAQASDNPQAKPPINADGPGEYVIAPLEGKFYLTKEASEKAKVVGDVVKKGETIGYIEAMKVINAITSDMSGTIQAILKNHGDEVEEDDQLFKIG